MYKKFGKRFLDIMLSGIALIALSPILLILAIAVGVNMGFPVLFKQKRIGKDEKEFMMYKFRTMNNKCDVDGKLLPDDMRVTNLGKFLRGTSLDELYLCADNSMYQSKKCGKNQYTIAENNVAIK